MKTVAVSIGDINGISPILSILYHEQIAKFINPLYVAHKELLGEVLERISPLCDKNMAKKLESNLKNMAFCDDNLPKIPSIKPGKISKKIGAYSYASFISALDIATHETKALLTLPIHKNAWSKAGIKYAGHTQVLSKKCDMKDAKYHKAIMMLGCEDMYVALFTEHVALKDVHKYIKYKDILNFLLSFKENIILSKDEKVCVLGLNPHCGDGGVMGDEEDIINKAIKKANNICQRDIFTCTISPDTAFTPFNRARFRYFVAFSHDVGLAPLKALYFSQSINISLNLPILRVSPDHGVAYDIAYKSLDIDGSSYIFSAKYLADRIKS